MCECIDIDSIHLVLHVNIQDSTHVVLHVHTQITLIFIVTLIQIRVTQAGKNFS